MSLDVVIVQTALPQPLAAQLGARARQDGISLEAELRHAVEHYMAWSQDRGEMRHRGDLWLGGPSLPTDRDLL